MKKVVNILIFVCLAILITYIITKNMKDNSPTQVTNSSGYVGKLGEVISYIDHPIISINDVSIKYIGTREQPATEQHVRLGDVNTFTVSTVNGKSFQIDWSSGTGDLPGPSNFITSDACYELQINIIEGKHLENIQGKLVLNKVSNDKCGEWAKDLR